MFKYLNLLLFTAKLHLFLTGLIALQHPGQPRIKKIYILRKLSLLGPLSFMHIQLFQYFHFTFEFLSLYNSQ